ncbi:serine/threonine protein kinase [Dermacoccus abyssi]|uniref:non-specific serine/threonine protein kinase n=1 Tax=Dermacoccus abyssi TaxID=322596 RepID=A0ABX5Z9U5_9MICO|nr:MULTISPECIES: serine/threonine-protein kinase [Dermacoccus]MBE7370896.1 serine/threonine protein kinase [Dermacoccus barathri]MCT1986834.1 serine/threonine protein kinase [Dermacoccus abyssi]QEH93742.1 serine/threonine protein kinase [Dermacoccus abyssi]
MGEMFAGRYELVDQIGEGGMGSVWRVHDHKSRRLVAAKLLRQSDAGSLLRFMREQGMRIEHSHVVTPLGWAGEDGRVIFTMPLIDGGSISDLIKDHGALPYPLVAELMRQMLDGLDACHSAGIVHRDIKPANILLEATGMGVPSAWITDFGIAVSVDAPRLTSNEMVLGTPGYMSPEQAKGDDPDPRQDLYSAGMMGIHMLTGVRPGNTTRTRRDDLPPRPADVPDSLWNVLVALADPVASRRPANARDAMSWLLLPENAWHDAAARNIPDRLPPMESSGDFVQLHAGAAARALDGFTDSSAAPQTLIDGAPVPQRRKVKTWMAAPACLLAALVAGFALWQPWGAGDGAYDANHASTGGTCYFSDAGSVATTSSGKQLTCTYQDDGSYIWQKAD